MENYLIEPDVLGKLVDELIRQKFHNQPTPPDLANLSEETTRDLNDQINDAIFDQLDESQLDTLNDMFDREEDNPAAFQAFLKNAGIDLEQTIQEVITKFSQNFLGGENA